MKFTIYVPLTPQILHTKFGGKKSNSFKEEVENVQKFTMDNDGQTRLAIGQMSDSGDLTKYKDEVINLYKV